MDDRGIVDIRGDLVTEKEEDQRGIVDIRGDLVTEKEEDQKFGDYPRTVENSDANLCTMEIPIASQTEEKLEVAEEKGKGKPKRKPKEEEEARAKVMVAKANAKATEKVKARKRRMRMVMAKVKAKLKLATRKKKKKAELNWWYVDDRNQGLLEPNLSWEEKVVKILHTVRCRELTEYNHKLGLSKHTRFCGFNIAFFDLDKESEGVPWKPIHEVPSPRECWLDDSVNVIAIKIADSDRDYPISIYGTVLARDEYDYRCVYLFRRGRDDPQIITSKDDMLTLIGPYRALAVKDCMYFEFHLKLKGDGDVDEDFSKGYLVHNAVYHTRQPMMRSLCSCLSTVELVYTPIIYAVEASFVVNVLKGPSDLISKLTGWTTENDEDTIVLYDREVVGVGGGGSVRGLVAVPLDEELVLRICVFEHCEHEQDECIQLVLGHSIGECVVGVGPCELQVEICWRGVTNRRGPDAWGRPNMWCHLGNAMLLL